MRAVAIWAGLAAALLAPVIGAGFSPLLQWRDAIYVTAGYAGIIGMTLLVLQPLLAARVLPGLSARQSRVIHRCVGGALALVVIVHVAGLWITSPPDVVDALTFTSPTPFSAWGVIAMWATFAAAVVAILRRRMRPLWWRRAHLALGAVIAGGTAVHALLITGTMETMTKWALAALVLACVGHVIWQRFPR